MSRLVFVEESEPRVARVVYDDSDDYYVQEGTSTLPRPSALPTPRSNGGKKQRKAKAASKEQAEPTQTSKSRRRRQQREDGQRTDEARPLEDDYERQPQPSKSAPGAKRRRSSPESEGVDGIERPGEETSGSSGSRGAGRESFGSAWLKSFIDRPREVAAVAPPPSFEPLNDTFLRGLAGDFDGSHNADFSDSESSATEAISPYRGVEATEVDRRDGQAVPEGSEVREPAESASSVTIRLFNLPYSASRSDVAAVLENLGCSVSAVNLKMDRRGLPAGAATCEVSREGLSLDTLLSALRQTEMGGRLVRAEMAPTGNRRQRSSVDGSRYFDVDISCKCFLCGQVGHKAQECVNPPLPTPCSLCAGLDHESQACPNIICFRCGTFGHQSKVCREARVSRAVVCSICGSTLHETSSCFTDWTRTSMFEGPQIVCMRCGKSGHACCGEPPSRSKALIYCHNCGEEGHQLDLIGECMVPRVDAYLKFPSLLDYDYTKQAAEDAEMRNRGRFRGEEGYNGRGHRPPRDRSSEDYRYPRVDSARILPSSSRARFPSRTREGGGESSRTVRIHQSPRRRNGRSRQE